MNNLFESSVPVYYKTINKVHKLHYDLIIQNKMVFFYQTKQRTKRSTAEVFSRVLSDENYYII